LNSNGVESAVPGFRCPKAVETGYLGLVILSSFEREMGIILHLREIFSRVFFAKEPKRQRGW